jgi:hypothetical protein
MQFIPGRYSRGPPVTKAHRGWPSRAASASGTGSWNPGCGVVRASLASIMYVAPACVQEPFRRAARRARPWRRLTGQLLLFNTTRARAHTLQTPYRDAAAVKHNAHLPVLLLLFNTTLGLTEVRNAVPTHTQTGTAPIILRKSEVHRRTHRRVALQTCGADFQGHQATVFRFNLT